MNLGWPVPDPRTLIPEQIAASTGEWDRHRLLPYQTRTVDHILAHPNAMVWADMGLGKTVSGLTAISDLLDRCAVPAALVVAPRRVIQTVWRQEAKKWKHLRHLTFSLVHGTPSARITALRRKADIYLINYENLVWLATQVKHIWLRHGKYPPFQMVVFDEVTKLKNSRKPGTKGGSIRGKALVSISQYFRRRVGLTGEPATAGYKDLFGQYLVVDGGQRLGTSVTAFRSAFLTHTGYEQRNWAATKTGKDQIHQRIADITIQLSAEDYLTLPPIRENIVWVDLPPAARKVYDELEKELFVELDSGAPIEAANEAGKIVKLLQVASGAVYVNDSRQWEEVHQEKMDAFSDIVEESGGRPLLCGYNFVHEADRIAAKFPEKVQTHEGASFISSKLGEKELYALIERWEQDQVPLLCGHPASMGHGLNLQGSSARATLWFSIPWSLDLYRQFNARLFGGHRRQGESAVHHILARDTWDEVVLERLRGNIITQDGLKQAVKAYRERRGL